MNSLNSRYYLVGMMWVGKTSTARGLVDPALSDTPLDATVVDMDRRLVREAWLEIDAIFAQHGEPHFRKLETDLLHRLSVHPESMVIATGGGAVCSPGNMETMKDSGTVIFLDASVGLLVDRILADNESGKATRPLAKWKREEIEQSLTTRLGQRQKIYEQAHHRIFVDWKDLRTIVGEILLAVRK